MIIGIFIPYLFLALLNRQLVCRGIEVKDPNSQEICTREVDLCLLGDYMFLCAMLGHQGSSSSFPCLRDYTPSSHLRKAHLDGSPHTPDNPSCRFERRTLESFDLDYSKNLLDKRNGGDMRKNGKYHGSVCSRRLIHLTSLMDVAVAGLHVLLALVVLAVSYLGLWCRIQDGVASEKELAKIVRECEEDGDDVERDHEYSEVSIKTIRLTNTFVFLQDDQDYGAS